MKNIYKKIWFIFFLYAIGVILYIYTNNPSQVPPIDQGSVSDPKTFMSTIQIAETNAISRLQYVSFFVLEPLQWIIYFIILTSGFSNRLKQAAARHTSIHFFQAVLYLFCLFAILFLIHLPIQYFYFVLNHMYHLTNQPIGSWFIDVLKSFALDLVTQIPLFLFVFWLIKKQPFRWWVTIWLLSIPVAVFLVFIQPIVVDPLFNDFKPLNDQTLRTEVIALTNKANVPTDQIFVVDKSKQTNQLNAYVTGIGNNTRIVYWDTLLKSMTKGEVLFVTAHEMGHYVKKDIYKGMAIGLFIGFGVLWLYFRIYNLIIYHVGWRFHVTKPYDIAALPLLLLLYSVSSFFISPLENAISRNMEQQADRYAITLTHDKTDAVRSFQLFARHDLEAVNPPFLVYLFLDDHPTLMQRIDFAEHSK